MTWAGARRDMLKSITVGLAGEEVKVHLGDDPVEAGGEPVYLGPERPLVIEAPGLRLRITSGVLKPGPLGALVVEIF